MGQKESQQTDEEIARLVQLGDIESFGKLVKRYEAKMMRYARKFLNISEDIEDVVQDVFIKAYVNIKSFDSKKKFSSWFYRIAHNEFVNALKKQKRKKVFSFFELDVILPYSIDKETQDDNINKEEIKETINKGLDKLESKYKEPIILYYLEELSYKEISEILRIPVSTVGIRLKRGREKLKNICKQLNHKLYEQ